MSKTKYVVVLGGGQKEVVSADRVVCEGRGASFFNASTEWPAESNLVAHFSDVESVVVEWPPEQAEPIAQMALTAAEPIRYTLGVASCFSSPASPLVEAIESTTRLVAELEVQDSGSMRANHLAALGDLSQHLNALLAEQIHQLCAPPPRMASNG